MSRCFDQLVQTLKRDKFQFLVICILLTQSFTSCCCKKESIVVKDKTGSFFERYIVFAEIDTLKFPYEGHVSFVDTINKKIGIIYGEKLEYFITYQNVNVQVQEGSEIAKGTKIATLNKLPESDWYYFKVILTKDNKFIKLTNFMKKSFR